MRPIRALPLRWKFVLVLVLGAVVPLGVVGFWLARSAERSGEELLRERLQRGLREMVTDLGVRWVAHRSHLLEIAEHPLVQAELAGDSARIDEEPLRAVYRALQEDIRQIVIRDAAGAERWTFRPTLDGESFADRPEPFVPVELGIYDRSGRRLGRLDARLRFSSLLSSGPEQAGVAGSTLGLFDRSNGSSLLPLSIDPDLFRQNRFDWAGEPWVAERQILSEPALELVLAAPVGPFQQPFAQATRRGTVALLVVAAASLALVILVTTRITRSLRDLAGAADAVAAGELERKVPEAGGAELERVARAFNSMTDSLRRTLAQLARGQSLAAVGEFAASLAHEVRNPLSSIRVNLQRAEERMERSPDRDLVTNALRSIERLENTVSGALRVARSGRVVREPVNLRTALAGAMRSAEPEFRRRGVHLLPLAEGEAGVSLVGDAAALEQVFLNLLLNAAQAQDAGGRAGIRVHGGDARVDIDVWDEGPGLSAEDRDRAFEAFYSTKEEGTGLGLAVVQQIVAAHGGEVEIESEVGEGTTVRVRLPLAPEPPEL